MSVCHKGFPLADQVLPVVYLHISRNQKKPPAGICQLNPSNMQFAEITKPFQWNKKNFAGKNWQSWKKLLIPANPDSGSSWAAYRYIMPSFGFQGKARIGNSPILKYMKSQKSWMLFSNSKLKEQNHKRQKCLDLVWTVSTMLFNNKTLPYSKAVIVY